MLYERALKWQDGQPISVRNFSAQVKKCLNAQRANYRDIETILTIATALILGTLTAILFWSL